MEGWSEKEISNRNLMAPCGLYCGACGVYIATRDGNEKFKAILGKLYGTKPEDTECCGCMQPDPPKKMYGYCKICNIRDCVLSKGFYSCHQCSEWPCDRINHFGFATGIRVMKKAIPSGGPGLLRTATRRAASNGRGRNVSAITARPAAKRFSGVRSSADPVKHR
jgi:hypothetical protein